MEKNMNGGMTMEDVKKVTKELRDSVMSFMGLARQAVDFNHDKVETAFDAMRHEMNKLDEAIKSGNIDDATEQLEIAREAFKFARKAHCSRYTS